MSSYRPSEPFTTAVELFNPIYDPERGSMVKIYPNAGEIIYCLWKTYGGTETTNNGQIVVVDTANVETWYRPDIISGSRLKLGTRFYEVIGEPENISQRNQFLKFKVRGVRGGA